MEKCKDIGPRHDLREADGRLLLRLTNFKTSNGPDVHVVLIAAKDADDDANFLKSSTERIELGTLKGNEGARVVGPLGSSEIWRVVAGELLIRDWLSSEHMLYIRGNRARAAFAI
jgi:hypothetical protein